MTKRFKKFITNRDIIIFSIVFIVSSIILVWKQLIEFSIMKEMLQGIYNYDEGTGIFVTIFCFVPIVLVIATSVQLLKSWKDSETW